MVDLEPPGQGKRGQRGENPNRVLPLSSFSLMYDFQFF
jgi:hypothetical protein